MRTKKKKITFILIYYNKRVNGVKLLNALC